MSTSHESPEEPEEEPAAEQEEIRAAPRVIQDAANRFVIWLRGPRRDAARVATETNNLLGRWVEGYFRRQGVPESEAEELTNDVWLRLFRGEFDGVDNGFALLCRARRSVFIDYLRARKAIKRTGGTIKGDTGAAEIQADDELWDALSNTVEAPAAPKDLQDCVQRKFVVFRKESPARAELVSMLTLGLSYKEMAAVVFKQPESTITADLVARIRNRIEEARKLAATYFRECEE